MRNSYQRKLWSLQSPSYSERKWTPSSVHCYVVVVWLPIQKATSSDWGSFSWTISCRQKLVKPRNKFVTTNHRNCLSHWSVVDSVDGFKFSILVKEWSAGESLRQPSPIRTSTELLTMELVSVQKLWCESPMGIINTLKQRFTTYGSLVWFDSEIFWA